MRNKKNIPHIVQDKRMVIGLSLKYQISIVCQFVKRKKEEKLQCMRMNFTNFSS